MTLSFWEKFTGVFEYPGFCPRCGVDTQPWKTRDVIHRFKCGACNMAAVVTLKQVPDKCPGCGKATTCWTYEKQLAETEKVPGEFCGPCLKVVDGYQRELKKGGVAWRCADCKGEGVENADSQFSKAVRALHPEGALVQMSRKNGCPLCGHLSLMEN